MKDNQSYLRGFFRGIFEELDPNGRKELKRSARKMQNTEIGTLFLQELKKFD